jgi:hypothetical protein
MALSTGQKVALWVAAIGAAGGITAATITVIGHDSPDCEISQTQEGNSGSGDQVQGRGNRC